MSQPPGPAGRQVRPATVPTAPHPVDPEFLALPLRPLADAALSAATAAGASWADFRMQRLLSADLVVRDTAVQTETDDVTVGYGVRVIVDGAWGFASSVVLAPEAAAATARRAVQVARAVRPVAGEQVERADEPVYRDVTWVGGYDVDPWSVDGAERAALLLDRSERLLAHDGVAHTVAALQQAKDCTFYADTAGTTVTQQRVRVYPWLEAVAVDTAGGSFETMRSLAPPVGRGWEYVLSGCGHDGEISVLAESLAEKLKAPSIEPGRYDLVIDPSNLWLVIHESVGHATEYDRAIGYEAAYAGTSFATPDRLGSLQYGSPVMTVTGDRTTLHGLASVGWDDDGVAAQSFELVTRGILTGYQLDRVFARRLGRDRSNGCAYADSPAHVPLQRMANVSLQPDPTGGSTDDLVSGVEDGILVVGDKSWSIDMQRYNFQFTGQRFHRIRNGRIEGQVRDVAYQATTTDFWGSMDAAGGPDTYLLAGAFNCGKGQPGQVAAVSHGCPSARFRGVNVLNTVAEGAA
ncbi:TldD/PmbA family protein [Nakamurella endophytica]|uniref:Peptidase U62, modulator of DNA gyrase n=1 Tax=Nakamurella endophytica TaxID=1748367 RepID=A0A917SU76_9ACTN|nr:TldD/PmbA family protein [Nakamurella endophytica]GGL96139.1 peptidase U62, modulator of DNA gyrase [Nakamurella endophytica]